MAESTESNTVMSSRVDGDGGGRRQQRAEDAGNDSRGEALVGTANDEDGMDMSSPYDDGEGEDGYWDARRESCASTRVDSVASLAREFGVTNKAKFLMAVIVLFALITVSQYIAAVIANSLALKADCVSMAVDCLSYMGNLAAECTRSPHRKLLAERVASGVSMALLIGFTISFAVEAIDVIVSGGDGDDVNAYIVLGFALGGVLFDVLGLAAYYMWGHTPTANQHSSRGLSSDSARHLSTQFPKTSSGDMLETGLLADSKHHMLVSSAINMRTACGHVVADLARSITTLVEATLILAVSTTNSRVLDGYCALVVCLTILIGASGAIFTFFSHIFSSKHRRRSNSSAAEHVF